VLRLAYSTINWGETPDLPTVFAEIREAGWDGVELFWHALDWRCPRSRLRCDLEEQRFAGCVDVEQSRSDLSPFAAAQANAAYLRGHGLPPRVRSPVR
jgi:hypothetical protein